MIPSNGARMPVKNGRSDGPVDAKTVSLGRRQIPVPFGPETVVEPSKAGG